MTRPFDVSTLAPLARLRADRHRPDLRRRAAPATRSYVSTRPSEPATRSAAPVMRAARRGAWTPASLGLVILVVVLMSTGLVFVASASSIHSLTVYGSSWYVFRRQLQWIGLGLGVGIVVMLLPYGLWRRLAKVIFGAALFGTLLTLTPFGHSRGGSRRWVGPESIAVQPTELLKLGLVFALAAFVCERGANLHDPVRVRQFFVRPFVVLSLVAIVPVLVQPDMGTAVILVLIASTIAVASGMPFRSLGKISAIGGVLMFLFAKMEPYRWNRVVAFLKPSQDLQGIGYHVYQSKLGFASGGLIGRGIGASRAKWGFLPNAHTDFIFAVVGEETGLLGAVLMFSLYGGLIFIGLHVARRSRERFGSLVAAAITAWISSQALINTGAVLGMLPVTGVPLPFVSVGGSSFVVLMAATGVLINIARTGLIDPITDRATRVPQGRGRSRADGATDSPRPSRRRPEGAASK